jgi:hypothetical protein
MFVQAEPIVAVLSEVVGGIESGKTENRELDVLPTLSYTVTVLSVLLNVAFVAQAYAPLYGDVESLIVIVGVKPFASPGNVTRWMPVPVSLVAAPTVKVPPTPAGR